MSPSRANTGVQTAVDSSWVVFTHVRSPADVPKSSPMPGTAAGIRPRMMPSPKVAKTSAPITRATARGLSDGSVTESVARG